MIGDKKVSPNEFKAAARRDSFILKDELFNKKKMIDM